MIRFFKIAWLFAWAGIATVIVFVPIMVVSLIFFPEGTRSDDGTIRTFKKGGFITAMETGWPILPVTVNGSRQVLAKRSLVALPGTIEVVVGDPIDTCNFTPDDIAGLIEATRETILRNQRN